MPIKNNMPAMFIRNIYLPIICSMIFFSQIGSEYKKNNTNKMREAL